MLPTAGGQRPQATRPRLVGIIYFQCLTCRQGQLIFAMSTCEFRMVNVFEQVELAFRNKYKEEERCIPPFQSSDWMQLGFPEVDGETNRK